MRTSRIILVLLVLLIPAISYSQPIVQLGGYAAGGGIDKIVAKLTPLGDIQTSDVSTRTNWYQTDAITRSTPVLPGTVDSTAMYPAFGHKQWNVWIYPTCTGGGTNGNCDSLAFVQFGVSARGNPISAGGDSLGAHPFILARRNNASSGAPDTLGGFSNYLGITDSTKTNPWVELNVIVPVSPTLITMGRGYMIPLVDLVNGVPWRSANMSVMVRYVKGFLSTGAAMSNSLAGVKYKVDLEGVMW
jgi:hypothetical protein